MAVTLPSDLVMDVMRSADPARRRAAEARLQSTGSDFARIVVGLDQKSNGAPAASAAQILISPSTRPVSAAAGRTDAAEGFEHMVLRSVFETLLPDEQSGAFGSGPSAGIWRSLAADHLAGVYTAAGGVGIAGMVDGDQPPAPRPDAQWPYFVLQPIKTFAG